MHVIAQTSYLAYGLFQYGWLLQFDCWLFRVIFSLAAMELFYSKSVAGHNLLVGWLGPILVQLQQLGC